MKLFFASAACDSKLRLPKYERTSAPEFPKQVVRQVNFC
jgi:hypothetical protein